MNLMSKRRNIKTNILKMYAPTPGQPCQLILTLIQSSEVQYMLKANANHKANQSNPNKGTSGSNKAYSKAQGNRGNQMNPNRK